MRVLVDTHAWLWWTAAVDRLGPAARNALEDPDTTVLVSMATSWEIAILLELKRIALDEPVEAYMARELGKAGVEVLPIAAHHLGRLVHLPRHHRDPFDRLLIAQALSEGVPFVTADRRAPAYGVEVLW